MMDTSLYDEIMNFEYDNLIYFNSTICDLSENFQYSPPPLIDASLKWQDIAYYIAKLAAASGVIASGSYLSYNGDINSKFLKWGSIMFTTSLIANLLPSETLNEYLHGLSIRSFVVSGNVFIAQALAATEPVTWKEKINASLIISLFSSAFTFMEHQFIDAYYGNVNISNNVVEDLEHIAGYSLKNGILRTIKETIKCIFYDFRKAVIPEIIPKESFIASFASTFISSSAANYYKVTVFDKMNFFNSNIFAYEISDITAKSFFSSIARQYNLSPEGIAIVGVLGGYTSSFLLDLLFLLPQAAEPEEPDEEFDS